MPQINPLEVRKNLILFALASAAIFFDLQTHGQIGPTQAATLYRSGHFLPIAAVMENSTPNDSDETTTAQTNNSTEPTSTEPETAPTDNTTETAPASTETTATAPATSAAPTSLSIKDLINTQEAVVDTIRTASNTRPITASGTAIRHFDEEARQLIDRLRQAAESQESSPELRAEAQMRLAQLHFSSSSDTSAAQATLEKQRLENLTAQKTKEQAEADILQTKIVRQASTTELKPEINPNNTAEELAKALAKKQIEVNKKQAQEIKEDKTVKHPDAAKKEEKIIKTTEELAIEETKQAKEDEPANQKQEISQKTETATEQTLPDRPVLTSGIATQPTKDLPTPQEIKTANQIIENLIWQARMPLALTNEKDQAVIMESQADLPIFYQTPAKDNITDGLVDTAGDAIPGQPKDKPIDSQAKAIIIFDQDRDGLPDEVEKRLGTDIAKSDTDSDGYLDGEEVKNGYSPFQDGRPTETLAPVEVAIVKKAKLEQPKQSQLPEKKTIRVKEIKNITPTSTPASTVKKPAKLSFAGQAEPNSTITLYIYSQMPIVITVKTDQNGNWLYELDKTLVDGQHEVYVAINDENGVIKEKSSPLHFVINQAQAVTRDRTFDQAIDVYDPTDEIIAYYAAGAIALIGMAFGVLSFINKGLNKKD